MKKSQPVDQSKELTLYVSPKDWKYLSTAAKNLRLDPADIANMAISYWVDEIPMPEPYPSIAETALAGTKKRKKK